MKEAELWDRYNTMKEVQWHCEDTGDKEEAHYWAVRCKLCLKYYYRAEFPIR